MQRAPHPAWLRSERVERAALEKAFAPVELAERTRLDRILEARLRVRGAPPDAASDPALQPAADGSRRSSFPLFHGLGPIDVSAADPELGRDGRQGRRDEAWEVDEATEARRKLEFESIAVTGWDIVAASSDPWAGSYRARVVVVPAKAPRAKRRQRPRQRTRRAAKLQRARGTSLQFKRGRGR